jgi:hypothetical protein
MSRNVFILGAGASVHAGAPLMANFLDKSRDLFAASPHDSAANDLSRVFRALSNLQAVHSKADLEFVNLEDVFGAFEMADLLGTKPSEPGLLESMQNVIAWTLDRTMKFSVLEGRITTTAPYQRFGEMIQRLVQLPQSSQCSVMTFNYDLGLDIALRYARLTPAYGLDDARGTAVKLLKLHGSIGWRQCPKCNHVVPEVGPQLDRYARVAEMSWSDLRSHAGARAVCCGEMIDGGAVIVPPSWNKSEYRSSLVNVWRHAAQELAEATSIFVAGYSLPQTDSFFKYLYGLGTASDTLLERFWVFDPNEQVHERFRALLGPGARARFRSFPFPFEQAVGYMEKILLP